MQFLTKCIEDMVEIVTEVAVRDPDAVVRRQGMAVRVVDNRKKGSMWRAQYPKITMQNVITS